MPTAAGQAIVASLGMFTSSRAGHSLTVEYPLAEELRSSIRLLLDLASFDHGDLQKSYVRRSPGQQNGNAMPAANGVDPAVHP